MLADFQHRKTSSVKLDRNPVPELKSQFTKEYFLTFFKFLHEENMEAHQSGF